MHQNPLPDRSIGNTMTERLFLKEHLLTPDAPDRLQALIIARIERATLRRVWTQMSLALVASLSILSYVFFSRTAVWLEIQESSILQLGRLFLSDPDILFSNVQDTFWTVVEAIPAQSVLLGLGVLLCITAVIGFSLRLREVRHSLSPHLT